MCSNGTPPLDRVQARDAENIRLALERMHATERQIADRLERQGRRRGWKVLAAIFHVDPDTLRRWRRCPDSFRVVHLAVLLLLEQQESRP